jgi:cyclohexanone monooxygenase
MAGFPNFFIGSSTAFCNYTVCAEAIVEWIVECIRYVRDKNYSRIVPTQQAEDAWVEHSEKAGSRTLLGSANGWFVGGNIEGKARHFLLYANPAPAFRAKINDAAAKGYEGFVLQ